MKIDKYIIFGLCGAVFVGSYFFCNPLSEQVIEGIQVVAIPVVIQNDDEGDQDNLFTQNVGESKDQVIEAIDLTARLIPEVTHRFQELEKKYFYTDQDRQELFACLGIDCCNEMRIVYTPILDVNPRESEKYLAYPDYYDGLTQLYADDIAAHSLMSMSVRWLGSEVGHGVFAEEDLHEGGFIGIYGGIVQDRTLVNNKDYAWSYPGTTLEGGAISLDANFTGNELRFINDGVNPNCFVRYVIGHDNLWHVCYVAARDIKKDEQLLCSYGPAYWDTRKYKYQALTEGQ